MSENYTPEETMGATIQYFDGDELAASTAVTKYLLRKPSDEIAQYIEKTPDDMHDRLAHEFHRIEQKYPNPLSYEMIRQAIDGFKFVVPQGSVMYGAGNPYVNVSLSNCVVVASPKDSMSGIFDTAKDMANLFKRRCGVGVDISSLRYDGALVKNSAGASTGAASFSKLYSDTCRMVGQSGRRGALMLTMSVRHPDIEKFVTMKRDLTKITGANISVMLDDEFMQAVENNTDFVLRWPCDVPVEQAKYTKTISAKDLWNTINESAKLCAEPGLIFIDNYKRNLPADYYEEFKSVSVNPCCFSEEHPVNVITQNGIKDIKDITNADKVWVDYEKTWANTSGYFNAGTAMVYDVEFENGEHLYITSNHKLEKIDPILYVSIDKDDNNIIEKAIQNKELRFLNKIPVVTKLVELQYLKIGDIISTSTYNTENELSSTKVVSISQVGIHPIGCIEVETYHKFTANGIISGNSEILLSELDSCRLLTENLKNYVTNPFTDNAEFDFDLFAKNVRVGQRLMDDIVDLEIECIEKILSIVDDADETILWSKMKEQADLGRRTGHGTHGLADAMARLCIRYDTDEAIAVADKIFRTLRDVAYDESVNLAIERGPFPIFDWEREKDCEFISRLPEYLKERIKKYGRRNISILTNAPTGSVAIVSQTASGIEPVFANSYMRRKKINPSDTNARIDFTDAMGDKWSEYLVFHHNVLDYMDLNPEVKSEWEDFSKKHKSSEWEFYLNMELPDYFVTAPEIQADKRVEIQGVIQSYLDHGISSTLNLPKGTTTEQIQDIYMQAWKYGLKGVTVYVDGSRSGVLVSASEKNNPEDIKESFAPKRPKELPCEIHRSQIDGQDWTILVGILNGKPYEIFGGASEHISLPKKYKNGIIVKRKCEPNKTLSCYDLVIGEDDDQLLIKDMAAAFKNEAYATHTRMFSMSLRHGIPIQFIVEQISKNHSDGFHSFFKVLARVLKKYISDGTKGADRCVECGEKLIFVEGCAQCPNCGLSKCN